MQNYYHNLGFCLLRLLRIIVATRSRRSQAPAPRAGGLASPRSHPPGTGWSASGVKKKEEEMQTLTQIYSFCHKQHHHNTLSLEYNEAKG